MIINERDKLLCMHACMLSVFMMQVFIEVH